MISKKDILELRIKNSPVIKRKTKASARSRAGLLSSCLKPCNQDSVSLHLSAPHFSRLTSLSGRCPLGWQGGLQPLRPMLYQPSSPSGRERASFSSSLHRSPRTHSNWVSLVCLPKAKPITRARERGFYLVGPGGMPPPGLGCRAPLKHSHQELGRSSTPKDPWGAVTKRRGKGWRTGKQQRSTTKSDLTFCLNSDNQVSPRFQNLLPNLNTISGN